MSPNPLPWQSPAVAPFAGCAEVQVVPPPPPPGEDEASEVLRRLPGQLVAESAALARELGAPTRIVEEPTPGSPTWWIGPSTAHPALAALGLPTPAAPAHTLDRTSRRLVTDAPDVDGILQALGGLRALARLPGGELRVAHARSSEEAVGRVITEVHDTFPAMRARGFDWPSLCRDHVPRVLGATNPVAAIQRWLATLGDPHTWVRPVATQVVAPYAGAAVDGEIVIGWVWPGSEGARHGVRPGWRLVGEDVRGTAATTPGRPHSHPMLVARRILSAPPGTVRRFEARGPGGAWAVWEETLRMPTGAPVAWERLPSGIGYLWIGAFVPGFGVEETVDEALVELADAPALIVDLRGNGGGRLALAEALRGRFLDRARTVGRIRSTGPGGQLGPAEPLVGVVPEGVPRWTKPVIALTSPLTYSAAEDFLLGLQGQPNVRLVGEATGGGSGRLRRLPLVPGWRLTITSSLTWDGRGRLVEGRGLVPDVPVRVDRRRPTGEDLVLATAESLVR